MQIRWSSLTHCIVIVFLLPILGGCMMRQPDYSPPPPPPVEEEDTLVPYNGPDPKTVEECDDYIRKQTKRIEELEGFISDQTRVNIIYGTKASKSRGWMKGDGDEHGDRADQAHDQIVATQKEINQIKDDIATVKVKRGEIEKQSMGCFMPDAMVQLDDGSFKPLADVAPGDMVASYDIGYQKTVSRPVVAVYTVEGNHLYSINNDIQTTGGERFLTQDGWKETAMLKVGDRIHVDGQMVEIQTIAYERTDHTLYNMQIEDTHNFYIATTGGKRYLVHNTSGGGGGGGTK